MKAYYYYHPESDSLFSSDSGTLHGEGDGLLEQVTKKYAMKLKEKLGLDDIEHIQVNTPIAIWMTDPHLSVSTIDLNISIYKQVFDIAENNGVNIIYLGGDIFESRNAQPESVLNVFAAILKEAQSRRIIIRAIPGNHDKTSYIDQSSFLDVYEPYQSFELVRDFAYYDYDHLRIHLVPYFDEKLAYEEYLNKCISNIDLVKKNILLTHIGIDGVLNNGKDVVETELNSKVFSKFDHVYIGHFHDRQHIPPNIFYTGSCYQANFGEDDSKGCGLLNSSGKMEYLALDFPKYVTKKIDGELTLEDVRLINEEKKNLNCNMKIQLVGDKKNVSQESISMLRNEGIKVENKQEEEVLDGDQSSFQGTFKAGHIKESFEEWVKEKKGLVNVKYGREKINNIL